MTPNEQTILQWLIENYKIQKTDSHYFDTDGGVGADELAPYVGLDESTVWDCYQSLEAQGYVEFTTRKEGARPVQAGIDIIDNPPQQKIGMPVSLPLQVATPLETLTTVFDAWDDPNTDKVETLKLAIQQITDLIQNSGMF